MVSSEVLHEIVCVKLQTTQVRLRRKIQEQDKEIKQLRRESSEISSTSESHYRDNDGFFKSSVSPRPCIQSPKFLSREPSGYVGPHVHIWTVKFRCTFSQDELVFGQHKVDQLRLANAKLQSDPGAAALKLMDTLFTTEEMVNGNPSGNTKSQDPVRRASITPLDPFRMKYIFGKFKLCVAVF